MKEKYFKTEAQFYFKQDCCPFFWTCANINLTSGLCDIFGIGMKPVIIFLRHVLSIHFHESSLSVFGNLGDIGINSVLLTQENKPRINSRTYRLYSKHSRRSEVRLMLMKSNKIWWKYNSLETNLGYIFKHYGGGGGLKHSIYYTNITKPKCQLNT